MGLDMYLFRKVNGKASEVGYWRKANEIHNWFVQNVQNGIDECQEAKVTKTQLRSLLSTTKKVLKAAKAGDFSLANSLLPTQGGFFFGSTDYDDYYVEDLENTVAILEKAIATPGPLYYQSSW